MQQGPQMNPYAPPTGHGHLQGRPPSGPPGSPEEAVSRGVCPQCGSDDIHKPSFTWWGGLVGAAMLKHTVCRACGFGYNGVTGLSNRGKIITYFVVVNALVLIVVIAMNMR